MRTSTQNRKIRTEKFVMLGAASTGKTSLVNRFAHDRFAVTSESTIGAAFVSKVLKIDDKDVKLEIWDTGGSEKYRSLAPMYYRDTHAAIIVFDVTVPSTLEDAQIWIDELKEKGPPRVLLAVAANKCDLVEQRQIEEAKLKDFAEKNQVNVVKDTSALNGTNVNELFTEITRNLMSIIPPDIIDEEPVDIKQTTKTNDGNKGCC